MHDQDKSCGHGVLGFCTRCALAQSTPARLDLRDLIYNPTRYTVDGKPLLSAKLELRTLDGSVFIHQHDYGLQEQRVSPAAGVATDVGGRR